MSTTDSTVVQKGELNAGSSILIKALGLTLITGAILASTSTFSQGKIPDFDENGNTIGCAWAKDVSNAKFVKGKGTRRIDLDIYFDKTGKNKIATIQNDKRAYLVAAKKNGFVKLVLDNIDGDKVSFGWAPFDQLFFGELRNCAIQSLAIDQ